MATPDVTSTVFDHAIAVAGDVDNSAHGVIACIGSKRARLGHFSAGRDADGFGFSSIFSCGMNGMALGVELPIATDSARAVGGCFNFDDLAIDQAIAVFFAKKEHATPAKDERGENCKGQNDHLVAHIVWEESPKRGRLTNRFIRTRQFGRLRIVSGESNIRVQDWAQPGDPFRLIAVKVEGVDWMAELPISTRERIARFSDATARARAGASEWFKACWLPRELGVERVAFEWGANGKPLLIGAVANWGFNLSHAGAYAVAVLAQGVSLGVDLESTSRKADIERLGRRVFSESEQSWVCTGGREAFFTLWSQKEALLKALGCGWADGSIVRRTQLKRVAFQVEPVTGVQVWSRLLRDHEYSLAIAQIATH